MSARRLPPQHLRVVPPPIDDERNWRRLFNHVYLCEEDDLFRWLREVRKAVETEAGKKAA